MSKKRLVQTITFSKQAFSFLKMRFTGRFGAERNRQSLYHRPALPGFAPRELLKDRSGGAMFASIPARMHPLVRGKRVLGFAFPCPRLSRSYARP